MRATHLSPGRASGFGDGGVTYRSGADFDKVSWIGACAARLATLRPALGMANARASALEMWPEVGHFDPGLAAELEHEAGPMDD